MSETRSGSHKRSKSALALSLLHRDKPKNENGDDDPSTTGSDADSETGPTAGKSLHHRTLSNLHTSRHKPLPTCIENPTSQPSNTSVSAFLQNSESCSQDVGETIEQSVRKFKLFEILRSGDEAAVSRAVKETSGVPRASGGEQKNTTEKPPLGALEGTTILHLAVQCADPSVMEQILSVAKATPGVALDLNARDREGNTPLHLAATLGRPSIVRLLLEQNGINDALVNYQGRSPLDLARNAEIFRQLQLFRSLYLESLVKNIQGLVSHGDYGGLEKLLEDSRVESVLDVNSTELATGQITVQSGGTLLHEAARSRDLRLIQLLLMHGADPFRRDRKGKLPQDVTKDDKTRNILKRSPAAAAAQRGIQEKTVLGTSPSPAGESTPGGKEAREMKGYLKKWTNYTSGYKLRWFVLEDGVLSYYKLQDDAGSACRGAINMKITTLHMDPQDKTKFEIQGKSSVKYHLKANHAVEAKRWFWTLTNAIQWTKDEVKEEQRQKQRDAEQSRKAKPGESSSPIDGKFSSRGWAATTAGALPLTTTNSRVSFQDTMTGPASLVGDDGASIISYGESVNANEATRPVKEPRTTNDLGQPDYKEEEEDDTSSQEMKPASKDAFNITAHSANLQLSLLAQVSTALQAECSKGSTIPISDPTVAQAISTYESAVRSLRDLVGDLLRISKDRDAYWQYRLDREADARRMWEESMAQVAKEQEALQGRIGESEDKRKRTKRALREALESTSVPPSRIGTQQGLDDQKDFEEVADKLQGNKVRAVPFRRISSGIQGGRRKSTIASLTNLSDSDSEEDEEFFDAVDAGEVEVTELPPAVASPPPGSSQVKEKAVEDLREVKKADISPSYKGYEDPVRQQLKLDPNNRPPRSLWNTLKSMIGKDLSKMALPVALNEPTSLLHRVAEDMEYTELLDTAAARTDSTERMLYVAAFAGSYNASMVDRISKPFNPLLGETCEYVRPDKGYRFLIEQVSHHPPVAAAWAESARWEYFGESAVKSKFYGKSFDIHPLGTWFLRLHPLSAPGTTETYTWKKITSSVIGIITGNPTVDNYGPMEIKNHTTGEVCLMNYKPRGWSESSAYHVTGKVLGKDGKIKWSIGGKWNGQMLARLTPGRQEELSLSSPKAGTDQAFLLWQANFRPKNIPFNLTSFAVSFLALPDRLRPLLPPTDTRFRPDQRAMEEGEWDRAATEKTRVEEGQRARKRSMDAKGEVWQPRWFAKGKEEVTGEECWISKGEYWRTRERVAEGGKWEGIGQIF